VSDTALRYETNSKTVSGWLAHAIGGG